MYATPIVYPMSQIPEKWQWVFALNPMSATVENSPLRFFGRRGDTADAPGYKSGHDSAGAIAGYSYVQQDRKNVYGYGMSNVVISVQNLYKEYRLGTISHGTLYQDIQSWWSRIRGERTQIPSYQLLNHSPFTIHIYRD